MARTMQPKETLTDQMHWTLMGELERQWLIEDKTQRTLVWKPVERPTWNGIRLYPATDAD